MAKKKLPIIVRDIRENPPTPLNFAIEKNISYSQLSMFTQCPKKWSLQYRDGHKISEQSIHMTFGTALHEVLQHYLDVMYDKSVAEADRIDLDEYFNEVYIREYKKALKTNNKGKHFSTPEEIREFFDDGIAILQNFKKKKGGYFSKKGWHLVGCEVPIVIPGWKPR